MYDSYKLIVSLSGLITIALIYWFFLLRKEKEIQTSGEVEIVVEGGYTPESVVIPKGKVTKITFIRRDSNECLSEVVLADFRIRKNLPLNEKVTVEIKPATSGKFGYSCGMNMYHGRIIVR